MRFAYYASYLSYKHNNEMFMSLGNVYFYYYYYYIIIIGYFYYAYW